MSVLIERKGESISHPSEAQSIREIDVASSSGNDALVVGGGCETESARRW